MNTHSNITAGGPLPAGFNAADEVDRARAIVFSVWLALGAADFSVEDASDVRDTLYEAYSRLQSAEKKLGVYHG